MSVSVTPTVLHLLPLDLERGAQRYARDLRDALNRESERHVIATLFDSNSDVLDADIALGMSRRVARLFGYDPRVASQLRKILRATTPRVVVAHGSEPLKYLAATRSRTPIVYYRIGVSHLLDHQKLRHALQKALLNRADVVVGVSSACIDEVVADYGVPREKTLVIPNGRRPQDFPPKPYPSKPGPVRLVFVGHLTETKRPGVFLDIVAELQRRGCAVQGTVVGGGPLLPEVSRRAPRLDVTVTGPTRGVADLLRESDVLVFTSIPTGEGMPGVLIEAGLVGLPCVATDVPGARDVVVDGDTGYIVGADHPMDAVERIERLVADPGRRWDMGSAARQRCLTAYSMDASAQAWRGVLAGLGESSSHPRRGCGVSSGDP